VDRNITNLLAIYVKNKSAENCNTLTVNGLELRRCD